MYKRPLPTQERLHLLFDYNEETGRLIFKHRPWVKYSWNSKWAGKEAGSVHQKGYIELSVENAHFLAHLVIWKWVHGFDAVELDHEDGNRQNNRIGNLRECTSQLNRANKKAHNRQGLPKGVQPRAGGRYRASIGHNYRMLHLGVFDTVEEAEAAYNAKAKELYGEFAYGIR